jgi:hypothetical protein
MVAPLDVVAVKNGQPTWLGCAQTLTKAFDIAIEHGDGSYLVFSQETGHRNLYEVTAGAVVPATV